jgi:RNA polymerase sigma-70 factor (ECF subfamily)
MGNPESSSLMQLHRDRRLVKAILRGDERAFRGFVDDYFPKLYRYARHRLPSEADVEEVVQTVLTQAARRLETYRGEATLLTWLIQICRHEISRQLGIIGKQRDIMLPFLNDDLLRSVVESIAADPLDNPEQQARRSELINLVQFALDQLPQHYAEVLELKYVEGFNSQEIAARLQTSDQATQSLLARARRAFREVCGESMHALYGGQG